MFQRHQTLHGWTFGLNRELKQWVAYRDLENGPFLYADSEKEIRQKIRESSDQ